MRTSDLIVALSAEAVRVPRVASVGMRFVRWLLVSAPIVAVFVWAGGVRRDLTERLADPGYTLGLIAIVALSLAAACLALVMSMPDDRRSRASVLWPVALAAAWGSALLLRLDDATGVVHALATDTGHFVCAVQIVLVALVPAAGLLRGAGAGASTQPAWTGMCAVLAAGAVAASGTALVCPIDAAAHQILWHFLPVISLAALGAVTGRIWLDRLSL